MHYVGICWNNITPCRMTKGRGTPNRSVLRPSSAVSFRPTHPWKQKCEFNGNVAPALGLASMFVRQREPKTLSRRLDVRKIAVPLPTPLPTVVILLYVRRLLPA